MRQIYICTLLMGVLLFSSCVSKRNYNKAQKFDQAGLYADAANLYYKSLKANKNNIDAKLGLQRTGQLVLDDKLEAFKNQYNNGSAKEAVYAYKEAEKYLKQLSGLGVKLLFPEEQKAYYEEVKDQYLDELYQGAMKALSLEEFDGAERQFSEILRIDRAYKDAQTQWITAKYEPVYRKGEHLINSEAFRSAYAEFDIINKGTKGYKNSIEQQAFCLKKATVSIATLPFYIRYSSHSLVARDVRNKVIGRVGKIKAPFYKVVGDESIKSVPYWSTTKDPRLAIKYAKKEAENFEAKSILSGDVQKYYSKTGKTYKNSMKAYLKEVIEVKNKETQEMEQKVIYKKVRYYEYEKENKVILSIDYKLDRVDKDELAFSDNFYGEEKAKMHYASFEGNYNQLVPGTWKYIDRDSDEDQVYDSEEARRDLSKLFKAKKEITSTAKLQQKLVDQCAKKIATDIANYKPEN